MTDLDIGGHGQASTSTSWILKFPVTVLRVLLCASEFCSPITKAED